MNNIECNQVTSTNRDGIVPFPTGGLRPQSTPKAVPYKTIIVVDHRPFIREALCQVLKASMSVNVNIRTIYKADQTASLSSELNSFSTIILYNTVHGEVEKTRTDLLAIRKHLDACRVCVLTDLVDCNHERLFEDFDLNGIIPSSFDTEQLSACLKIIETGVPFMPIALQSISDKMKTFPQMKIAQFNDMQEKLTPRQKQIVEYIVVGRSNKYIAAELSLCESTIKFHVSDLMRRLGATSRTHAVYLLNN